VVFLLASVVVIAATRGEDASVPSLGTARKTFALAFVVVLLASLSGSAVFYNVAPIDQQPGLDRTVEVRDYSVGYAEDVPEGYVNAVSIPIVDYSPQINTSGVIVTSPDRYVWRTAIRPAQLKTVDGFPFSSADWAGVNASSSTGLAGRWRVTTRCTRCTSDPRARSGRSASPRTCKGRPHDSRAEHLVATYRGAIRVRGLATRRDGRRRGRAGERDVGHDRRAHLPAQRKPGVRRRERNARGDRTTER